MVSKQKQGPGNMTKRSGNGKQPKHPTTGKFITQTEAQEIARRASLGHHVSQQQLAHIQNQGKKP
jgi:hypothetical protein